MVRKLLFWAPLVVAVLAVAYIAFMFNRAHQYKAERDRLEEARELELKDQLVAAQVSAKEAEAKVEEVLANNVELRKLYATALAAAPGARPTGVADLSTGAAAAHGTPSTTQAPCLLAEGDAARVDVTVVELETEAKNHVIVATAKVVRLQPTEAVILKGEARRELSKVTEVERPPEKKWGAGGVVICDWGSGCGAGPAADVSFRVLGLEALLHAGFTVEGKPKVSAALTVRF